MDPENRSFFNCVISGISALLREITLTISDSTAETVSMESEIVRVISLNTIKKSNLQGADNFISF